MLTSRNVSRLQHSMPTMVVRPHSVIDSRCSWRMPSSPTIFGMTCTCSESAFRFG